jgi:hypothetical protein
MEKSRQTTVILSEKAQPIKDDLAPVFGLKNILSAGLVLLSRLSADEQKAIIAEAVGRSGQSGITNRIQKIREILATSLQPGYKILSKDESEAVSDLRKALGPEPAQKKKAKGG